MDELKGVFFYKVSGVTGVKGAEGCPAFEIGCRTVLFELIVEVLDQGAATIPEVKVGVQGVVMGKPDIPEGVHVLPDHRFETGILSGDRPPVGDGDLLVHVEGVVGELPAAEGGEFPLAGGGLHLLAGPEK